MTTGLHARLALEDLARRKAELSGSVDAADLSERLASALAMPQATGVVEYRLRFGRAAEGGVAVTGDFAASFVARCQRCLERLDLRLEVPVRLLIPEAADAEPPPEWEVAEVGARPTLGELLEEELLLALPIAPRHPPGTCASDSDAGTESDEPSKPLAGISKLLDRGRDPA